MRTALALLLAFEFGASGATNCVLSTATGTGSGADWVNAMTQLPNPLVRGDFYWVGAGTGYVANMSGVSGAAWTYVVKATPSNHGTSTGWSDSFGTNQAFFNPRVLLASSNIWFDGVSGYGSRLGYEPKGVANALRSGFHIIDPTNTDVEAILIGDKYGFPHYGATNIVVANVEIECQTNPVPGIGAGINASAFGATYQSVTISNCYLHDLGELPLNLWATTNLTLTYCWVGRNASDVNNHGVLVRMDNLNNWTVSYNIFEDAVGTGFVGAYDGCTGPLYVFGNVFDYSTNGPSPGGDSETTYGTFVLGTINNSGVGIVPTNWFVFQNTFKNLPAGNAVQIYVSSYNCVATNNLFYGSNVTSWAFQGITHDYNAFGATTNHDAEGHPTHLISYPFSTYALLASHIAAGVSVGSPYNVDAFGNQNGDIGAYSYGTNDPAVSVQPQSQTVTAGQGVVFTITASGLTTLSYQWKTNGVNAGTNGPALGLANVLQAWNGMTVTCTVSDTAGNVTSSTAILSVLPLSINAAVVNCGILTAATPAVDVPTNLFIKLYTDDNTNATVGVELGTGGMVERWKDQSGTAHDFTNLIFNTTCPTWLTNAGPGGTGYAIQFDNPSHNVQCVGQDTVTTNQPVTVIVVCTEKSTAAGNTIFDCNHNPSPRQSLRIGTGSTPLIYAGSSLSVPAFANTGNWFIFSTVFNGANSYVRTNGVLAAAGNAGAFGCQNFMLGNDLSGATAYTGKMVAFLAYGQALNTNQLINVERYLNTKYNLGYTIPGP